MIQNQPENTTFPRHPDRAARRFQIAHLRRAFGLTTAQAALLASLAFGERGAE